jgi:dUTP pyrophosphatase
LSINMSDDETIFAGALNREAIKALVNVSDGLPLVAECIDLTAQLQPNGFDVTVGGIARINALAGDSRLGVANDDRRLPEYRDVAIGRDDWWHLSPGSYLITFNEVVNLPHWLMALGRPRSSLLRMGVSLHTAVWDAGYSGRSQALLVAHHPRGIHLQRNARVAQLVFLPLNRPDAAGYAGLYQGENL